MDNGTVGEVLQQGFRWGHVVAGIAWIGILYWFNFVNSQIGGAMDAETKKKLVPEYMPRSLWFFRWGAMFTFLFGLALFAQIYMHGGAWNFDRSLMEQTRVQWILVGMLFGTIMWFNVWFIIWPAQQKVIPAIKAGTAGEGDIPALAKRAGTASKVNTYLSFPMVWCMVGAQHFTKTGGLHPGGIIIILLLFLVPWVTYKYVAPAVKGM